MCISAADKIDNMRSITDNLMQGYNIFKNMQGTPEMQLNKFTEVYKVIKDKVPVKLQSLYEETLENFVKILHQKKNLF